MEGLQGPINSSLSGEQLEVNCFEKDFVNTESLAYQILEQDPFSLPSLEDKMPFLQMLQAVETPKCLPFIETNHQTLSRLQLLKTQQAQEAYMPKMQTNIDQPLENHSNLNHDMVELPSPAKSQSHDLHNPILASQKETLYPKTQPVHRERRKRKRTRQTKNKEDVENQRMTHIAVERNRRRQMNDHLSVLRSLMPPSYIQRGDQASVIGGAIDFVKELEQLLQSLEALKKIRTSHEEIGSCGLPKPTSPNCRTRSSLEEANAGEEVKAENKSENAEIEVNVIQTHVNLKIQCKRRPGQLLKAILALEDLRLTVLHLNITSSQALKKNANLDRLIRLQKQFIKYFSFDNGKLIKS